jgi:hypothetical protein
MDSLDRIITAPIGAFCLLSGLGRTRVYELIGAGQLDSVTIGKRRLVIIESYRQLIERQRAVGQKLARPGTIR